MRRQLYSGGGITNIPRQGYGLGSWVKKRIRKLIPNELADVAVKAAPFVAPFNPGIAGLMRGIGRFDQRGSISDALKQGALTYGGGQLARQLGGAGVQTDFLGTPGDRFTTPLSSDRMEGLRNLFKAREKAPVKEVQKSVQKGVYDPTQLMPQLGSEQPLIDKIMTTWKGMSPGLRTAIVGAGSGAIAGVAQWFENQVPQEPGESMEEYVARRNVVVGKLMRQYLDNTRAYDAEWTAKTDEQKTDYISSINMNQGGRVGYQAGGISMGNTLAQNIAANNAQRAANQAVLQGARKKAFNVFMTPKGNVAKDQGIAQLARDTGIAPQIQNYAINSGTDISRMIGPGTGITDKGEYGNQTTYSNLGFAALPSSGQTTTTTAAPTASTFDKQASINAAAAREAKAKAYYQALEQKQLEAYGRGVKTMPEFIGGDPYKAEAATLGGMNPGAYMDYLLTGDPQDLMHKYYKDVDGIPNPDYDPQFASYDDIYGTMPRNPYDVYYEQQLQRQIDAGIPESERIQKGQVMGMPGVIPTGGTAATNTYESYADALARTKAAMGLNQGGRVGLYAGGNGTPLPEDPTKPINPWAKEGIKSLEAGAPDITYEGNEGPQAPQQVANVPTFRQWAQMQGVNIDNLDITQMNIMIRNYNREYPDRPNKLAQGGRIGQMYGTGPAGLPGIPRQAPDGMEFDMRMNGGFQGLGKKEGKDDVPAMLAKNEFVFTADAVRGAGGGDIELGAQRMYDTMKKLERRVG